jgi:spermidine synthase
VSRCGLSPSGSWVTDPWRKDVLFSVGVDKVIHDSRSKYQHIQVLSTSSMGRLLVLDGALQCAEGDEASYHEMIAHVPMLRKGAASGGGKRALIIGGGDGGAARELLRHEDIASVDLVDIDAEVMRVSKELLPSVWRHPHSTPESYLPLDDDPRLNVLPLDGLTFVEQGKDSEYDVIIVDASDPVGPGAALYAPSFYAALRRKLRAGGAVAVQGSSFWYLPVCFRTVFHGLKSAFPVVKPYQCFTAIYPGGLWNLQVATLGDDPADVDRQKADSLKGLQFYSSDVHGASFALPPVAHKLLAMRPPTVADASQEVDGIMAFGEAQPAQGWEASVLDALTRALFSTPTVLADQAAPLMTLDADGTLWTTDAAEEFINHLSHAVPGKADIQLQYEHLLAQGYDREAYMFIAQLFEGMTLPEIHRLTHECFEKYTKPKMIPTTCDLVRKALSKGWQVKIVTASPAWVVEPGALALGLRRDDVLGIRVRVDPNGKATKDILMVPLREGKVEAIKAALPASMPTIAAGNSIDDVEMLSLARGVALVVNPSSDAMARLATERGWQLHRYGGA